MEMDDVEFGQIIDVVDVGAEIKMDLDLIGMIAFQLLGGPDGSPCPNSAAVRGANQHFNY